RRIRTDTSTTLFVAAGAGTGKTTELVARVLQLVRDGVLLAGVAAITFTEAAAAELRDRVRAGLEDAARREDDPRLREAVAQVDDQCVDRTDKLALELQRMREQADRLAAAGSDLEALHLLASARAVSPGQGRCTSWRCTKEEVQAAVKAANDARAAALAT